MGWIRKLFAKLIGGIAGEVGGQVAINANQVMDRSQQLLNHATVNAHQVINHATTNAHQLLEQIIYESRAWQKESQEWRNLFQALMMIFFAITIMFVFYKLIACCCFSSSKNKPTTLDDNAIERIANDIAEKIMESEQGTNDLYDRTESEVQHRSNEKSGIESLAKKLLSSNPINVDRICVPNTAYYLSAVFIFIAMVGDILAAKMVCGENSGYGDNLCNEFAKHGIEPPILLGICLLVAYAFGAKNALAKAENAYATDAKTTITIEELGVGYFNDNFGISLESAINTIKEANNIRKLNGKSGLDMVKVTALLNKQGIFAPRKILISGCATNIADALERKAAEYGRDARVKVDLDTHPIVYTPSCNIL